MNEEYSQDQFLSDEPSLEITDTIREHLLNAAKWGRFLAIVGFVGIGFTVLLGLFFGAFMSMMSSGLYSDDVYGDAFSGFTLLSPIFYTVLYLVIAAVYFFPVLYLYRFSRRMLNAIPELDQYQLESSFSSLRSMFKFMGILTIIIIALYGLIFVVALFGGLAAMI